jgi:hypothetical protein
VNDLHVTDTSRWRHQSIAAGTAIVVCLFASLMPDGDIISRPQSETPALL